MTTATSSSPSLHSHTSRRISLFGSKEVSEVSPVTSSQLSNPVSILPSMDSSSSSTYHGEKRGVSVTPLKPVSFASLIPHVNFSKLSSPPVSQYMDSSPCSSLACPNNEPKYSPPLGEGFIEVSGDCELNARECILTEELNALNELVDGMRVDLLQTSMLVDYIKDYLKKM